MSSADFITIVDEHDNVVGSATISEARAEGKIHRISRVMVENSKGDILLQKRDSSRPTWPNCWDNSAAGHVDVGEDYLEAAKRELFEEIGIKADELEEVGTYYNDHQFKHHHMRRFNRVYKYKTDETPTNLQAEEVSEVKWFSLVEVKKLVEKPDQVTDGLVDVIKRYY